MELGCRGRPGLATWHRGARCASSRSPDDGRLAPELANLSVVIPAYNEAARLETEAARLDRAVVSGLIDPSETEFVVVDDGSTDETADRIESLWSRTFPHLRVLRLSENSGKGAAIRAGVSVASAPVVAFMDADMAVDPRQIPRLLAAIDTADVAIGSRALRGSRVVRATVRRKVMGRIFSRVVRTMTSVPLADTQCGFKAFRTPIARILFHLMKVDRFAFDVELLYLAHRLGIDVAEVPVEWHDVGGSTVRPMVDSLSMMSDVFRMRQGARRPEIPALTVKAPNPETESIPACLRLEAFGPLSSTLPILPLTHQHSLLLFPLCEDKECARAATRVQTLWPTSTVTRWSVSLEHLETLGAHRLLSGEGRIPATVPNQTRRQNRVGPVLTGWRQEPPWLADIEP